MRAFVLSFLLLLPLSLLAQDRSDLEQKRKRLIREIGKTTAQLKQTKLNKKEAVEGVVALNNQILNREQLLVNLETEISLAERSILRSEEVIVALSGDIKRLQNEYTRNVRRTWRLRKTQHYLVFVLNGEGLAQVFRRFQYLRQYDRYRRRQAQLIADTRAMLMDKRDLVTRRQADKAGFVDSVENQKTALSQEKKEQERQVQTLKKDEARLATDLETKERNRRQLDNSIEDMIIAEMRAKKEKAKRESGTSKPSAPKVKSKENSAQPAELPYQPTAEEVNLNQSFTANKGKLTWPVTGTIWSKFGKQRHPTVPSVFIENQGLDIKASDGEDIRAVFDGVVSNVQATPGYGYTVLLNHGTYYTVYAMVEGPQVRAGQKIKTRQVLGQVGSNNLHQQPLVHFELWRDKTPQDPSRWLQ